MRVDRPYRKSKIPAHAERVFEGVLFNVYQWEQEQFDGTTVTFEKIERSDAAFMIPVLEDGRILLVEDEQPGEHKQLVVPAGLVDPGEEPEGAARRELLEETGYAPASVALLATIEPERKIDWVIYYYIGHGCTKVQEALIQPGERITPRPTGFDEFVALATDEKLGSLALSRLVLRAQRTPQLMAEFRKKILGPLA